MSALDRIISVDGTVGTDAYNKAYDRTQGQAKKQAVGSALESIMNPDATTDQRLNSVRGVAGIAPDEALKLRDEVMQMDAQTRAQRSKELEGYAAIAIKANTPELWQQALDFENETRRKQNQPPINIPFEQREGLINKVLGVKGYYDMQDKRADNTRQDRVADSTISANEAKAGYYRAGGGGMLGGGVGPGGGRPGQGQRWANPEKTVLEDIPGGQRDKSNKPLPARIEKEFMTLGDQFGQVNYAMTSFKPEFSGQGFMGMGGDTRMAMERIWDEGSPASTWWQGYQKYKNIVRADLFGAALTPSEQAEFDKADISANMGAEAIKANLAIQKRVLEGAMARRRAYAATSGLNMEAVDALIGQGSTLAPATDPAPEPGGFVRTDGGGMGNPQPGGQQAQPKPMPKSKAELVDGEIYPSAKTGGLVRWDAAKQQLIPVTP